MVAYSFQKQFEKPIVDGLKPHTLRNERKRHARPGEEVQLYVGMRTKHCRLLGRATCKAITPIRIDFKRCAIRIGARGTIHGIQRLDAFAVTDGFADWAGMRAFWMKEHGKKKQADGSPAPPLVCWSGVIIEWAGFRPA